MTRCSEPWCAEEAEPGCEAPISGEPTCRRHDYLTIFTSLARLDWLFDDEEKGAPPEAQ